MPAIEVRPIPLAETRIVRKQVLRPHQSLDELATHEPPGAVAFGAFDRSGLIGVGLVGAEGEPGDWRVRGMATLPHARGRGAGSRILQALVHHAAAHGAKRVWCNARVRALPLYQRAGFAVASELFEPSDIGPHYRMELPLPARG